MVVSVVPGSITAVFVLRLLSVWEVGCSGSAEGVAELGAAIMGWDEGVGLLVGFWLLITPEGRGETRLPVGWEV